MALLIQHNSTIIIEHNVLKPAITNNPYIKSKWSLT